MEHVDAPVLLGVPLQLVVVPVLLHPQVRRHDLVLQVLKNKAETCQRESEDSPTREKRHVR